MFESMAYANKPAIPAVRPIHIVYSNNLWKNTDQSQPPSSTLLQTYTSSLLDSGYLGPVVIDIEQWPVHTDSTKRQWLLDIMAAFKSANPLWEIGNYAIAPVRNHTASLMPTEHASYLAWEQTNQAANEIAKQSDILFPSLYTMTTDMDRWSTYAVQNVIQAKKYWPQKPIIPFLWPQYHNGVPSIGLQYIDPYFWKHQLMIVYQLCDGCILWKNWTNPLQEWDYAFPWFQPTWEFIFQYADHQG